MSYTDFLILGYNDDTKINWQPLQRDGTRIVQMNGHVASSTTLDSIESLSVPNKSSIDKSTS